jgi:hypothetical protein
LIKDNCQCRSQRESSLKKVPPIRLVELWRSFYYELVPDGSTINAEVYSQQLEKMCTVLLEK